MTNNADISVLGAGVFGLVASIMIKKKGLSVTVVDRNFPPMEASSWALGRVDPLLETSSVNSKKGKYNTENYLGIELISIYWHYLAGLWLYLYFFMRYI